MSNYINNVGGQAPIPCGVFGSSSILRMKLAASVVLKGKSGRFVVGNDSDYVAAMSATSVNVLGWAVGASDLTASATAGATSVDVETDFLSKLFVMPACKDSGAAVTEANLATIVGETFDVQMVDTNYQYADLGASAVDILLGYGYIYEGSAVGHQFAIVKINPVKLAYTSHTDI